MLKAGYKYAHKLSTTFVQVWVLPTVSTVRSARVYIIDLLYGLKDTDNTQFIYRYAQAILINFNLLILSLCPVSTVPTNTTNLIKE